MSGRQKRNLPNSFDFRPPPKQMGRLGLLLALLVVGVGAACQSGHEPTPVSENETVSAIDPAFSQDRSVSIPLAVYPLKNFGSPSSAVWVGPTLTELLISDLSHWSQLTIVSRGNMTSVLREQWIQTLHSDSEELIRVGRLQGARLLVQGGFLEDKGQVIVDVQIIDVETGVIWDTVRAEGRLSDLHLLEQSLARLLLERLPRDMSELNGFRDEGQFQRNNQRRFENSSMERDVPIPGRKLPQQLIFQDDMSISEGRRSHWHEKFVRAAKNFFERGITVELGRPFQGKRTIQEQEKENTPFLYIPLGAYAEKKRMGEAMSPEVTQELALRVLNSNSSSPKNVDRDFPELQIVLQQLALPRRMYVRARSDEDEIVAVFSRWEWRTDRVMSFVDGRHMNMPFWPSPFMTGMAEFPANWLNRGEIALTFDTVFLEIHQDETDVTVEWIESQQPEENFEEKNRIRQMLTRQLQRWIQDKWKPHMGETLPSNGYLPHNKQRGHLRLQVENGIITKIIHQYSVSDPLFSGSLEELATHLLQTCPWCMSGQSLSDELQAADFRVQCTLIKPTLHVGLGSRRP